MRAFTIRMSDIDRCPQRIWAAEHWREDGTCAHEPPRPVRALPARLPEDEQAYAYVARALNYGAPTDVTLAGLDPAMRKIAQVYAQQHRYPWPPVMGDYDRYQERKRSMPEGCIEVDRASDGRIIWQGWLTETERMGGTKPWTTGSIELPHYTTRAEVAHYIQVARDRAMRDVQAWPNHAVEVPLPPYIFDPEPTLAALRRCLTGQPTEDDVNLIDEGMEELQRRVDELQGRDRPEVTEDRLTLEPNGIGRKVARRMPGAVGDILTELEATSGLGPDVLMPQALAMLSDIAMFQLRDNLTVYVERPDGERAPLVIDWVEAARSNTKAVTGP